MAALSDVDWFPLWLSLRIAFFATILTVVFGTWVAHRLSHGSFRGKQFVDALITLPLVLPPTVLGYYLLIVISRNSPVGKFYEAVIGQPLVFTWQAAVLAACLHAAPLYIRAARALLETVDYRFEWASTGLGASSWITFCHITLPLVRPGLTSLTILTFARALGDFGATIMVAGNIPGQTQTLSVAIYDAVESGNGRLARILVLVVSVGAFALLWPAGYLAQTSRPHVLGDRSSR